MGFFFSIHPAAVVGGGFQKRLLVFSRGVERNAITDYTAKVANVFALSGHCDCREDKDFEGRRVRVCVLRNL